MSEDIQRTLGEMDAKLDTMGREMKEVKADVKEIQQTCLRREAPFKRMERHLETDKPVEQFANEKAARLLYTFLGAVVALAWFKMPAIVSFLFSK